MKLSFLKLFVGLLGLTIASSAFAGGFCVATGQTDEGFGMSYEYKASCTWLQSDIYSIKPALFGYLSDQSKESARTDVIENLQRLGVKKVAQVKNFEIFTNENLAAFKDLCLVAHFGGRMDSLFCSNGPVLFFNQESQTGAAQILKGMNFIKIVDIKESYSIYGK